MRIIARLNVGGPARQACLLHERLSLWFDCRLVVGNLADGEQDMSYLLCSESNVIRLPMMSREVKWWSDVRAFWKILRLLRKERPDVVHTHTAKAGALGRTAAWLAGVPIIVHTYHGHVFRAYFGPWRTWFYSKIERILGHLTTRVIAISESQATDLSGKYRIVDHSRISIIHNGFDLQGFSKGNRSEARKALGLGTDDFIAVWVGRMAPIKDVALLNDVVRKAAAKRAPILFLVVGDGNEHVKLNCLDEAGANVRWLGWRRDIQTIWKAADVALLTSRDEGTPTVLVESMAAGIPFVATNVGGVQDLAVGKLRPLPDNFGMQASNGFLVSRNPDAFLHCLETLQQNPELKRQMGETGKMLASQQFSEERLVRDISLLYQGLLKESRMTGASSQEEAEERSPRATDVF